MLFPKDSINVLDNTIDVLRSKILNRWRRFAILIEHYFKIILIVLVNNIKLILKYNYNQILLFSNIKLILK